MQTYNNSFFAPTDKKLSWNKSLVLDKRVNTTQDEAKISNREQSKSILKESKVRKKN